MAELSLFTKTREGHQIKFYLVATMYKALSRLINQGLLGKSADLHKSWGWMRGLGLSTVFYGVNP